MLASGAKLDLTPELTAKCFALEAIQARFTLVVGKFLTTEIAQNGAHINSFHLQHFFKYTFFIY